MTQVMLHLEKIHRPSLASCSTVSREFFQLASPILYKKIIISPDPSRDSRADHDPKAIGPNGRINPHTRKRKLLLNAQHLTVDWHSHVGCNKSQKCPRLHTLQLELITRRFGPVLHWGLTSHSEKQCAVIKQLRPKRLVIRGASLFNIQQFPIGFSHKLYEDIEELIFLCPLEPFPSTACVSSFDGMDKIQKIVWIFQTQGPNKRWRFGDKGIFGRANDTTTAFWSLGRFLTRLPLIPVLLVNAGAIDMSHSTAQPNSSSGGSGSGTTSWDDLAAQLQMSKKIHSHIQSEITPVVWPNMQQDNSPATVAKVEDKLNTLKFLTMDQYLATESWEGVLEQKEVQPWLDRAKQG